jgi:hypothetical protein
MTPRGRDVVDAVIANTICFTQRRGRSRPHRWPAFAQARLILIILPAITARGKCTPFAISLRASVGSTEAVRRGKGLSGLVGRVPTPLEEGG